MPFRTGRRLFISIALAAGGIVVGVPAANPALALPVVGDVVISEVYGGGGNTGAQYSNDFIELRNRTGTAIDLTGTSVQYNSTTGTVAWQVTALTGSIPANGYYLIAEAAGANPAPALPTPNATGTIAMSGTGGKVAFVSNTTALSGANGTPTPPLAGASCPTDAAAILDLVGYGAATCSETTPTAATTNSTSAQRLDDGATDTDNNSADFTTTAPNPQIGGDAAPSVLSTSPGSNQASVALDANITITFNEPVVVPDPWTVISCTVSGAHAASTVSGGKVVTLNPTTDFVEHDVCTVTLPVGAVADADSADPPDNPTADYVWTFQTDALPVTLISQVQGPASASPLAGHTVVVEAIVTSLFTTADVLSGFFVQEQVSDDDNNPLTSEGVFVTCAGPCATSVALGDAVRVTGTVAESFSRTQIANNVTGGGTVVLSSLNPLPPPTTITMPAAGSTRSSATFENLEGMAVTVSTQLRVTEFFELARFGHVVLTSGPRPFTYTHTEIPTATGFTNFLADLDTRRIFLDDDNNDQNDMVSGPQSNEPYPYPTPSYGTGGLSVTNRMRAGDTILDLIGVMDWDFAGVGTNAWRIRPIPTLPYTFTSANPAPAPPTPVGGRLRVSAFNVLNYFTTVDLGPDVCGPVGGLDCRGADSTSELARQREKMIASMLAMDADVAGLMEIQNDAGASTQDIVAALNAQAGTGTYAFVNTGALGTDAIKVAIIYQPAMVTPVGSHVILDATVDPNFDTTRNRPALIQTFEENSTGEKFTIAVNHLKSKGSGCGAGDDDTTTGAGNCNGTRTRAAQALATFLAADQARSGDPDYVIMGDLNAYRRESPITTLTGAGYTDLIEQFIGDGAYSYLFDGQIGYLDHALATSSLAAQVTGVTEWHINADENPLFDYNDEILDPGEAPFERESNALALYAADPRRSSDHDPIVFGLDLSPVVAPGAPTGVVGAAGDGQVVVSWNAPASTGGSPITGYTVTSSPGGFTCTTATTSCTVTGLTNGTPYTFTVVASNAVGAGPPSAPSAAVAPRTVPGAPTGATANPGDRQATVSWSAPVSDGGSAIIGYTVTAAPGGATCTTATLSCTVAGLTNGTAYTFTVVARNIAGDGPPSDPSNTVTPVAPPSPAVAPGAPRNVTGVPAIDEVAISWTAPLSDGGTPITTYTATASPSGLSCTTARLTCTIRGLVAGTPYTFTVTATNAIGTSPASEPSLPVIPLGPGFAPLQPTRLFDTRPTDPQGSIVVVKQRYGGPGNILKVKVTGVSGIPSNGVEAVALNVTVVDPVGNGFVTVYPCGTRPLAANLNYVTGQTVPNLVIAPVSASGEVCLFSLVDTHLVADVSGWLGAGSAFTALTPTRLADTRPTEPQGAVSVAQHRYGGTANILRIKVTGVAGIPATGVGAVSLNVTAVDPVGPGFVTVFPCGPLPVAANINYVAGQIVPNAVLAAVSPQGEVCLYSYVDTHLVVDVNGWFVTGSAYTPMTPVRAVDTRPEYPQGAVQVAKQTYGGEFEILRVRLTGVAGVPASDVGAVALNVTVVDPIGPGYLTAFPCGPRPLAANVNYVTNQTVPNAVIAPVSAQGEVCFFSLVDTHIVIDVNGWFATT